MAIDIQKKINKITNILDDNKIPSTLTYDEYVIKDNYYNGGYIDDYRTKIDNYVDYCKNIMIEIKIFANKVSECRSQIPSNLYTNAALDDELDSTGLVNTDSTKSNIKYVSALHKITGGFSNLYLDLGTLYSTCEERVKAYHNFQSILRNQKSIIEKRAQILRTANAKQGINKNNDERYDAEKKEYNYDRAQIFQATRRVSLETWWRKVPYIVGADNI